MPSLSFMFARVKVVSSKTETVAYVKTFYQFYKKLKYNGIP